MAEQLDLFSKKNQNDDAGRKFSKYVVYVDESGDHSLESIDANYPIFVLAFCIFHKDHYCNSVVPSVERFKFHHFGHDHIVLHEREIRKEEPPFNIFKSREERNNFLDGLSNIVRDNNFIITASIIDKTALRGKQPTDNPYHIALGFCLDSLYKFLQEKREHRRETHVIVEMRGEKEDKALELEFRRICESKDYPFKIRIAAKKVNSSGLQLADLVARPIGMNFLKPEQENRAFDILKMKFCCEGGRQALGVGYEDWGLKIHPQKSERPR